MRQKSGPEKEPRIRPQRACAPPCPIATTAIHFCLAQPRSQSQPLLELPSSGGHTRITDVSSSEVFGSHPEDRQWLRNLRSLMISFTTL